MIIFFLGICTTPHPSVNEGLILKVIAVKASEINIVMKNDLTDSSQHECLRGESIQASILWV